MNFEGGIALKPYAYLQVGSNDLVVARQKSARGYDRTLLAACVSPASQKDYRKKEMLDFRSLLRTNAALQFSDARSPAFIGTQKFCCQRMSTYNVDIAFSGLGKDVVDSVTERLWETFGDVTVHRYRHYGSASYDLSAEITVDVFSRLTVSETLSPPRADFELRRAKSRARLNDERAHNWLTAEWLMKIVGEFSVDLLPLVDEKALVRFLTREHQYAHLFPGLCGDLSDAACLF